VNEIALAIVRAWGHRRGAALQLSEALLVGIGIPMGSVIASIHQRRDEFRTELNKSQRFGRSRRSQRR